MLQVPSRRVQLTAKCHIRKSYLPLSQQQQHLQPELLVPRADRRPSEDEDRALIKPLLLGLVNAPHTTMHSQSMRIDHASTL